MKRPDVAMPDKPKPRSEARIEFGSDHKLAKKLRGLGLGQKVTVEITGKICRASADQYDSTICLKVEELEIEMSLGEQVESVRNQRRG